MKYLVLLAVIAVVYAVWRGQRSVPPPPGPRIAPPQDMVACAHCGVHLPQGDAIAGEAGRHYCSRAHQRLGPG